MDRQGYERGEEKRDVDERVLVDGRVTTIRSLVTCITIHYYITTSTVSILVRALCKLQRNVVNYIKRRGYVFCIYLWACLVYNSTDKVVKILGAVFARGNLKTITDVTLTQYELVTQYELASYDNALCIPVTLRSRDNTVRKIRT